MRTSSIWKAALAGAALLHVAATAHAQGEAKVDEGALKYRQSLMEAVGGDMAALTNILKYGLTVPGAAQVHAEGLASHAKLTTVAFERKVTAGPTDAEPAIWEKPDEFAQSVQKFEAETAKLVDVAKNGDLAALGAQVKATGKSCGSCHDSFRKPKEESFKRKGGGS
ncbi:MAG: cytochrome C [Proteobacteria bacterium]|nr:MAG: cytochrome C [Pseudomonadota bacterium]